MPNIGQLEISLILDKSSFDLTLKTAEKDLKRFSNIKVSPKVNPQVKTTSTTSSGSTSSPKAPKAPTTPQTPKTPKFNAPKVDFNLGKVTRTIRQINNLIKAVVNLKKTVDEFNNSEPLKPKKDDGELTELNKHLEQKKKHLMEVRDYFDKNPITSKTQAQGFGDTPEERGFGGRGEESKDLKELKDLIKEDLAEQGKVRIDQREATTQRLLDAESRMKDFQQMPIEKFMTGFFEQIGHNVSNYTQSALNRSFRKVAGFDVRQYTDVFFDESMVALAKFIDPTYQGINIENAQSRKDRYWDVEDKTPHRDRQKRRQTVDEQVRTETEAVEIPLDLIKNFVYKEANIVAHKIIDNLKQGATQATQTPPTGIASRLQQTATKSIDTKQKRLPGDIDTDRTLEIPFNQNLAQQQAVATANYFKKVYDDFRAAREEYKQIEKALTRIKPGQAIPETLVEETAQTVSRLRILAKKLTGVSEQAKSDLKFAAEKFDLEPRQRDSINSRLGQITRYANQAERQLGITDKYTVNPRDKFQEAVKSAIDKIDVNASSIGKDVTAGINQGIDAEKASVEEKARDLGKRLEKSTKKILGIESPSRVFIQIGRDVIAGLKIGLEGDDALESYLAKIKRIMKQALSTGNISDLKTGLQEIQRVVNSANKATQDIHSKDILSSISSNLKNKQNSPPFNLPPAPPNSFLNTQGIVADPWFMTDKEGLSPEDRAEWERLQKISKILTEKARLENEILDREVEAARKYYKDKEDAKRKVSRAKVVFHEGKQYNEIEERGKRVVKDLNDRLRETSNFWLEQYLKQPVYEKYRLGGSRNPEVIPMPPQIEARVARPKYNEFQPGEVAGTNKYNVRQKGGVLGTESYVVGYDLAEIKQISGEVVASTTNNFNQTTGVIERARKALREFGRQWKQLRADENSTEIETASKRLAALAHTLERLQRMREGQTYADIGSTEPEKEEKAFDYLIAESREGRTDYKKEQLQKLLAQIEASDDPGKDLLAAEVKDSIALAQQHVTAFVSQRKKTDRDYQYIKNATASDTRGAAIDASIETATQKVEQARARLNELKQASTEIKEPLFINNLVKWLNRLEQRLNRAKGSMQQWAKESFNVQKDVRRTEQTGEFSLPVSKVVRENVLFDPRATLNVFSELNDRAANSALKITSSFKQAFSQITGFDITPQIDEQKLRRGHTMLVQSYYDLASSIQARMKAIGDEGDEVVRQWLPAVQTAAKRLYSSKTAQEDRQALEELLKLVKMVEQQRKAVTQEKIDKIVLEQAEKYAPQFEQLTQLNQGKKITELVEFFNKLKTGNVNLGAVQEIETFINKTKDLDPQLKAGLQNLVSRMKQELQNVLAVEAIESEGIPIINQNNLNRAVERSKNQEQAERLRQKRERSIDAAERRRLANSERAARTRAELGLGTTLDLQERKRQLERASAKGAVKAGLDPATLEKAANVALPMLFSGGSMMSLLTPVLTAAIPMILPLVPAIIGGMGLTQLIVPLIQKAEQSLIVTEPLEQRLNFLSGSPEAGRQELGFVREVSEEFGLDLETATRQYSQLAAAARRTRLEGKPTKDLFRGIAASLAALKLNTADSSLVMQAYTQIISKGRLSMEELRLQLAERFPPAMGIFSKALGVSVPEMVKLITSGSLLAEDVMPKVAKVLSEDFSQAAKEGANSFIGAVNRLNSQRFEFSQNFARAYGGLPKAIKQAQSALYRAANENFPIVKNAITTGLISISATVAIGLQTILSKGKAAQFMQKATSTIRSSFLSAMSSLSPFLIIAFADLLDDVFDVDKTFLEHMQDGFTNIFYGMFSAIRELASGISGEYVGILEAPAQAFKLLTENIPGVELIKKFGDAYGDTIKRIGGGAVELTVMYVLFQQIAALTRGFVIPQLKSLTKGVKTLGESILQTITGGKGLKTLFNSANLSSAALTSALGSLASSLLTLASAYAFLGFSKGRFRLPLTEVFDTEMQNLRSKFDEYYQMQRSLQNEGLDRGDYDRVQREHRSMGFNFDPLKLFSQEGIYADDIEKQRRNDSRYPTQENYRLYEQISHNLQSKTSEILFGFKFEQDPSEKFAELDRQYEEFRQKARSLGYTDEQIEASVSPDFRGGFTIAEKQIMNIVRAIAQAREEFSQVSDIFKTTVEGELPDTVTEKLAQLSKLDTREEELHKKRIAEGLKETEQSRRNIETIDEEKKRIEEQRTTLKVDIEAEIGVFGGYIASLEKQIEAVRDDKDLNAVSKIAQIKALSVELRKALNLQNALFNIKYEGLTVQEHLAPEPDIYKRTTKAIAEAEREAAVTTSKLRVKQAEEQARIISESLTVGFGDRNTPEQQLTKGRASIAGLGEQQKFTASNLAQMREYLKEILTVPDSEKDDVIRKKIEDLKAKNRRDEESLAQLQLRINQEKERNIMAEEKVVAQRLKAQQTISELGLTRQLGLLNLAKLDDDIAIAREKLSKTFAGVNSDFIGLRTKLTRTVEKLAIFQQQSQVKKIGLTENFALSAKDWFLKQLGRPVKSFGAAIETITVEELAAIRQSLSQTLSNNPIAQELLRQIEEFAKLGKQSKTAQLEIVNTQLQIAEKFKSARDSLRAFVQKLEDNLEALASRIEQLKLENIFTNLQNQLEGQLNPGSSSIARQLNDVISNALSQLEGFGKERISIQDERRQNARTLRDLRVEYFKIVKDLTAFSEHLNNSSNGLVDLNQATINLIQQFDNLGQSLTQPNQSTTNNTFPIQGLNLNTAKITSGYGWRNIYGRKDFHEGIDVAVPGGTNVVAAGSGVVKGIYPIKGTDQMQLMVESINEAGQKVKEWYIHLSKNINVHIGDLVRAGDKIGEVAVTSQLARRARVSTGDHLDYRVQVGGKWIDPKQFLGNSTRSQNIDQELVNSQKQLISVQRENNRIVNQQIKVNPTPQASNTEINKLEVQQKTAIILQEDNLRDRVEGFLLEFKNSIESAFISIGDRIRSTVRSIEGFERSVEDLGIRFGVIRLDPIARNLKEVNRAYEDQRRQLEDLTIQLKRDLGIDEKIGIDELLENPEDIGKYIKEEIDFESVLEKALTTADINKINPDVSREISAIAKQAEARTIDQQEASIGLIQKLEKAADKIDEQEPIANSVRAEIGRLEIIGKKNELASNLLNFESGTPNLENRDRREIEKQLKLLELDNKRLESIKKINEALREKLVSEEQAADLTAKINDLYAQQRQEAEELTDFFDRFEETIQESFATNLKEGFASFFKAQKSGWEALGDFAVGILESIGDKAAEIVSEGIVDLIFGNSNGGGGFLGLFGGGNKNSGGAGLITDVITTGLFARNGLDTLDVPHLRLGTEAKIPVFMKGYDTNDLSLALGIKEAIRKEAHPQAFPAVLHKGEVVLSDLTGDAQYYRKLKAEGQWRKADVQNYRYGTPVQMGQTVNHQGNTVVNYSSQVNVVAHDANSFKRTRNQIARRERLQQERASRR